MVEIIAMVIFGIIAIYAMDCLCSLITDFCSYDLERIWQEEVNKEKELRKDYFKYWVSKNE